MLDSDFLNLVFGEKNLQKERLNFLMYYYMLLTASGNQCVDVSLIHSSGAPIMRMNVNFNRFELYLKLTCIDMVFDNDPLICKYIAPPKELQSLNCAVFYCGMIESVLVSNGFVNEMHCIL